MPKIATPPRPALHKHRLAIEIDGGYHESKEQKLYDFKREQWLKENRHCNIKRFTNKQVFDDVDSIVNFIVDTRASWISQEQVKTLK